MGTRVRGRRPVDVRTAAFAKRGVRFHVRRAASRLCPMAGVAGSATTADMALVGGGDGHRWDGGGNGVGHAIRRFWGAAGLQAWRYGRGFGSAALRVVPSKSLSRAGPNRSSSIAHPRAVLHQRTALGSRERAWECAGWGGGARRFRSRSASVRSAANPAVRCRFNSGISREWGRFSDCCEYPSRNRHGSGPTTPRSTTPPRQRAAKQSPRGLSEAPAALAHRIRAFPDWPPDHPLLT